jgi:DMSO reductase anchor subunit
MAELKDKITNALNESRILILGAHILLGFQYRSIFEPGFDKLPHHTQYLKLLGLALMLVAVAFLIAPSAYHRIVAEGEDTEDMHRFTSNSTELALLPFAIGLGIDFFAAAEKVAGRAAGIISGLAAALVALFFWYGLEALGKMKYGPEIREVKAMQKQERGSESGGTKLKDKIKQVLTEARTVIPGAQALLGFQFAIILMESFERLPESSKYVHLACLALVTLSVVLLMTPAAYHRIVEQGEDTERFHRFSSRVLLASMIPLALGVCGDLFVVVRKVSESVTFALASALVMMLFFYGFWFGYTAYRRSQSARKREPRAAFEGRQTAD